MSKYKVGDKVILTVTGLNDKVYYPYYEFNNNKSNLFKYVVSDISISISTSLFTFPLTGLIFKQFSVISPITNILVLFPANLFINLSLIINFLYNLKILYNQLGYYNKMNIHELKKMIRKYVI